MFVPIVPVVTHKSCPGCGSTIRRGIESCPRCGRPIPPEPRAPLVIALALSVGFAALLIAGYTATGRDLESFPLIMVLIAIILVAVLAAARVGR